MFEENQSEIELARNFDLNSIDAEFISNPFPTCRALRNHSPIHRNADGSLFLTRYSDVMMAYRHPAMSSDKKIAFKEKFGDSPLYTHHTTSLIFNDPPYHTVVRKLLAAGFTPRKLRSMEPLIEKIDDIIKSASSTELTKSTEETDSSPLICLTSLFHKTSIFS